MSNLPQYDAFYDQEPFDPIEYFKEYDYFEKYDKNKLYTSERFIKDYGRGKMIYLYALYVFSEDEKYIVAENDALCVNLEELIPYCRCLYHSCHPLNPLRLFMCYHPNGCLEFPSPDQDIINASRKYMKEQNNHRKQRDEIIRKAREIIIQESIRR